MNDIALPTGYLPPRTASPARTRARRGLALLAVIGVAAVAGGTVAVAASGDAVPIRPTGKAAPVVTP